MGLIPHFLARQWKTPQCSDYPDVLIPLGHAERHHSVIEKAEKDGSESPPGYDDEKGQGRSDSIAAYDVHTIEGLRSEVERDAAAFGANSAYDRMYQSLFHSLFLESTCFFLGLSV